MNDIKNIQAERYRRHLQAQAEQARRQKILVIVEKYNGFTPLDWAAKSIQKLSRRKQKPSERVVIVDGIGYPFSMATSMIDEGTAPFDEQHAISIYDHILINHQNAAHYGSPDLQLSPHDQVVFALSCSSKRTEPEIFLLVEFFNEDIFNQLVSVDLSENPELARKIRTIIFLLNGEMPDWIFKHFPAGTNLEEFVPMLIQDIHFEMEEIGKRQARLEEVHWRPNPNDEVMCTICQEPHLVRDMHTKSNGSFLYCTVCAPRAGIFPLGYFPDDDDF